MAAAAWLGPGVGQPKLWWGRLNSLPDIYCACPSSFKLAGKVGRSIENIPLWQIFFQGRVNFNLLIYNNNLIQDRCDPL